ncbi:phospho-sugar mutase [Xylanimonas protaetiae]|uniref:phospho-sugar mutase n=1 Tax=Xylanimonas protaetiae TaxID=2509457 RepID=UPI0013EA0CB4|nr:phospho-sugar mutase [Xylanimonas protaetiae]
MTDALQSLLDAAAAWERDDVDDADKADLRALVDRARGGAPGAVAAQAELRDRFAATLQFGTAGLRGAMAAGPNRMNRAVVIGAAAGLGAYLRDALPGAHSRVVVGFDARHRSADFARDTAAVLTAQGAEVLTLPAPLPTPVLSFAVRHLGADAGVMVTASHNPAADNGYKVYLGGRVVTDAGQGAQIVPPYDALIAEKIAVAGPAAAVPRADDGWTVLDLSIVDDYVQAALALRDDVPRTLRIVTTSLHGVGGQVLGRVLAEAGFARVTPVEEQRIPDPDFPTVVFPNPEEKGAIDMAIAVAQDAHADVVIANDPDADRCAVAVHDKRLGTYQGAETATSQGWRMLHGDEVGALLGDDIASRLTAGEAGDALPVLANSVVSSRLLAAIATRHGLAHATTLTGFKWISRTPGLVFGYEEALGYCVDPERVRDKDGISAALVVAQLANRLKASGLTLVDKLDDLAREHGLYLTDQLSVRFEDLAGIPAAMARLRAEPPTLLAGSPVVDVLDLAQGADGLPPTDGVRLLTQDGTRVIVRPSGTEPKVKCYLEVVRDVPSDASVDAVGVAREQARKTLATLKHDIAGALGL